VKKKEMLEREQIADP